MKRPIAPDDRRRLDVKVIRENVRHPVTVRGEKKVEMGRVSRQPGPVTEAGNERFAGETLGPGGAHTQVPQRRPGLLLWVGRSSVERVGDV